MIFQAFRSKVGTLPLTCIVLSLLSLSTHDTQAQYNDITLQSVTTSNVTGNNSSNAPSIDNAGRYIVFQSLATNLGGITDNNNASDVFLRDSQLNTTTCVSTSANGTLGNKATTDAVISGDASTIAFQSLATNLVPYSDSNNASDIFLKLVSGGTVTRVSQNASNVVGNGASTNPALSTNGQYVAFESLATNLTSTSLVDSISDIFLYSTATANMTQVTRLSSGYSGNGNSYSPAISGGGQYVAFASASTNLVGGYISQNPDIYVYNSSTGEITRASVGVNNTPSNGASNYPSISSNGQYVVFSSAATNLTSIVDTNNSTDIFLRDLTGGTTTLVSIYTSGVQSNGNSVNPVISPDGSTITFLSDATNLVTNDFNNTAGDGIYDVFVYNVATKAIQRADLTSSKNEVKGTATLASLSSNGQICSFDYSGNLTAATSSYSQVYKLDLTCTADSDGDGVNNCADQCPTNSALSTAGACGCSSTGTGDADGDGVLDCVDQCPGDPLKSAPALCGCDAAETDVNTNGITDCIEISSSTVPAAPLAVINANYLQAVLPTFYNGVQNEIKVLKNGAVVATKTTPMTIVRFTLRRRGTYQLVYRVKFAGLTSQPSQKVTFKVKNIRR